jgi:ATP-binding cassette subfamily B protein
MFDSDYAWNSICAYNGGLINYKSDVQSYFGSAETVTPAGTGYNYEMLGWLRQNIGTTTIGSRNDMVLNYGANIDNRLFIGNLFEFLDLQPSIVNAPNPKPFPLQVKSVEFRDITFRYPKMERDVLSHFNLTARAGEVTQIEGENGFGKTTLLKLLLRLYDTDQGAVLVDGVDVRQYDLKGLRHGIGAIFQDYVRFYCTAEENIAFGDVEHYDHERVRYVAELAGVDKYIEHLPKGFDTPLGRMFDGGEELSMGQWQRIALARQLYSNAPVLIFDEPTAWMDVPSRDRFYQTLEMMKQEGKVIILIKHV